MEEKITLSIYILTYNRAETVKNQVEFFIREIEPYSSRVELIVSDNASTDNTEEYMRKYEDNGSFRYIRNEKNAGLIGNAYLSIERVRGEYVWIIGDDPFESGVVKRVVDIIDEHQDLNFVYLNARNCYGKNPFGTMDYVFGDGGYCEYTWGMLKEHNYALSKILIFTSGIIHRRETLEKTFSIIPVDGKFCYAWSYYAGLLALFKGRGYFEKKIWVYDQLRGVSWSDYAIVSYSRVLTSHKLLQRIGVKRKEINRLRKDCLYNSPVLEMAFLEFSKFGKYWKEALYTILYSMYLDPLYTIKMFLFDCQ